MPTAEPGRCPEAEAWATAELETWSQSIVRTCGDAEAAVGAPTLQCLPAQAGPKTSWTADVETLSSTSFESAGPLVVTSTLPGEGKTTTALGLASQSARRGNKTLLVDTDCRFAGLPRLRPDIEPSPGLREASRGVRPVETLIQREVEPGLDVLPCGLGRESRPPDFERLSDTLGKAAAGYQTVLVDTTPFLPVPDTFLLLKALPASRLVVLCEAGRSTTFGLRTLHDRALETDTQLAGLIVTRVNNTTERLQPTQCWTARLIGSALASNGTRAAVGAQFCPPGQRDGVAQWWILERQEGGWTPVAQAPELSRELLEGQSH